LVLGLLVLGFATGYFFPHKSYIVVQPNWIRANDVSFTVETSNVSCEKFTINVLGFFGAKIAPDVTKSPQDYLQLYSTLKIETNYPFQFSKLEENKESFGFHANHHDTVFSVNPPLLENEKYNITVVVGFSKFAGIRESVPFELELNPTGCS